MLRSSDVPKPQHLTWIEDDQLIRIYQKSPRREILLAGPDAELWRLIDMEEHCVADLISLMAKCGFTEATTSRSLNRFLDAELVSANNYLWLEEDEQ
jgi:hypothetical protein